MRTGWIAAVAVSCWALWSAHSAVAGPYVSATGAATFLSDSDLKLGAFEGETDFERGFGITGAAGWAWDFMLLGRLRTEIEAGHRKNDVDEVSMPGFTVSGGDADVRALSGMANVALDLNVLPLFQPYVMGGIGVANVKLESDEFGVDDDDNVFAYQAGAGVGVPVGVFTLFGGYRFFATADPELEGTDLEYRSHSVEVGVRIGF